LLLLGGGASAALASGLASLAIFGTSMIESKKPGGDRYSPLPRGSDERVDESDRLPDGHSAGGLAPT
jgi:hypothetical protein